MFFRSTRIRSTFVATAVLLLTCVGLLPGSANAAPIDRASTATATSDLLTIYRYYFGGYGDPYRGSDHITVTAAPQNPSYQYEQVLGKISPVLLTSSTAIYDCGYFGPPRIYVDHFTSVDPACEGQIFNGLIGYIFTAPPAGYTSTLLYRCRVAANQEIFDTTQSNCEGQILGGVLGYVVTS